MPYLLREQLGRVAAFTAGALLAFGPSYLYFSRFAREDIYIACVTLAMLVVVFRFFDHPKRHHPAAFGAPAGAVVRDQGDDVHHDLRGGLVLPGGDRGAGAARGLAARRADRADAARRALGRLGVGRDRVPRRLHRHLHDVLHQPEGHLRAVDGARLLARPARRRPRRGAGVLLRRPAVRRRVAGAAARRRGRGGRLQAPDAAAAVPGVGVRGLAGRLLVGGREVRVADPAPAAAADPARRRRPAGDLGVAAHA